MPFKYGYLTARGGKVHAVATTTKVVILCDTEQEARNQADRLNQEERSLKTPYDKAEWFQKWTGAPDKTDEAYGFSTADATTH